MSEAHLHIRVLTDGVFSCFDSARVQHNSLSDGPRSKKCRFWKNCQTVKMHPVDGVVMLFVAESFTQTELTPAIEAVNSSAQNTMKDEFHGTKSNWSTRWSQRCKNVPCDAFMVPVCRNLPLRHQNM